ncbi:MAG: hypothetical protein GYB50_18735 [Rhodobacteraceae bacterium]|nr:hypothetical protein [Paracoccaceae bacterium]
MLVWALPHFPAVLAGFLALLFVFVVAGFFIEEKSLVARLIAPAAGFVGGAAVGGGVAATIGGIGIVAMGTGVGLPAMAVIGVGTLLGGLIGGVGGFTFELVQFARNPAAFDVDVLGLIAVALVALGLFFLLRMAIGRMVRRRDRQVTQER